MKAPPPFCFLGAAFANVFFAGGFAESGSYLTMLFFIALAAMLVLLFFITLDEEESKP